MNKKELIEAIAKKTGQSIADSEKALTATLEAIKESVVKGDKVTLKGFGTFAVFERRARKGRNPRTGAEIRIPTLNTIRFRPGSKLIRAADGISLDDEDNEPQGKCGKGTGSGGPRFDIKR